LENASEEKRVKINQVLEGISRRRLYFLNNMKDKPHIDLIVKVHDWDPEAEGCDEEEPPKYSLKYCFSCSDYFDCLHMHKDCFRCNQPYMSEEETVTKMSKEELLKNLSFLWESKKGGSGSSN